MKIHCLGRSYVKSEMFKVQKPEYTNCKSIKSAIGKALGGAILK